MRPTPGLTGLTPDSRRPDWRGVIGALAVLLVFRSAIADWNHVPSGSMLPSILIGDRIVVDKLAYDLRLPFTSLRIARWAEPARGDVVTFRSPEDGRLLVKRVVGVPGDLLELTDDRLVINGTTAAYARRPCPLRPASTGGGKTPPLPACFRESAFGSSRLVLLGAPRAASRSAAIRVPADHLVMLGDHRAASRDSRQFGPVERDRIVGRVTRIAFSLDPNAGYRPRIERFLATVQ